MTTIVVAFVACLVSNPNLCREVQLEATNHQACMLLGQHAIAQWMRLYPGHVVSQAWVCKPADTPA